MGGCGTWEGAPQQSLVHFAVVHWHHSLMEALERGLQRVRQYMREKATLLLGAGLKTKASGGFRDKSFSLKTGKSSSYPKQCPASSGCHLPSTVSAQEL